MTAPILDRPTVPEAMDQVVAFYRRTENWNGGLLHIVLADGNLHRPDIRWCRQQAEAARDREAVALADTLLLLSMSQIRRLYRRLNNPEWTRLLEGAG